MEGVAARRSLVGGGGDDDLYCAIVDEKISRGLQNYSITAVGQPLIVVLEGPACKTLIEGDILETGHVESGKVKIFCEDHVDEDNLLG